MADNVWIGGTTDWGTASNWSTGAVPTATDGNVVVFSGSSPACTLGAANRVCNHLMMTGYTNTLTFSTRTLTVSGNITLGTAHTISVTTGTLAINESATIKTNGYIIPANFRFDGTSKTYTLDDDLWISPNALSFNGTTSLAINNNKIYAFGGSSVSAAGVSGTTKLIINGTGTLSSTGSYQLDMDIASTGTTTFGTSFRYSTRTLTYVSGSTDAITNSNTFYVGQNGGTGTTLNVSAITWYNVTTQASATVNLSQDLYVSNQYTNTASLIWSGNSMHIGGYISLGGSQILHGSTKLLLNGNNCTWIGSTGTNRLNTDIITPGEFVVTGTCIFNSGTLTYISGATNTSGGTLNITSSSTLQTSGMSWTNVIMTQGVLTLNSKLNITDTLAICSTSGCRFAGIGGFEVGTLSCTTINRTITLATGNTYTVNNSLILRGRGPFETTTNRVNIQSSTSGVDTILNLNPTGDCKNAFVLATDVNSSGGRVVTNVKGSLTRTTNWYVTNPDAYFNF